MSERKAVTLAVVAVALITIGACATVMMAGGGDDLAAATMIVVSALGVDRMTKLMLSFDRD